MAKDAIQRYVGSVRVLPVTDRDGFGEWQSSYDTNDDAAVGAFCNPIYQAALGALKRSFLRGAGGIPNCAAGRLEPRAGAARSPAGY